MLSTLTEKFASMAPLVPLRIAYRKVSDLFLQFKRDVSTGEMIYKGFRDPIHRLNLHRKVGFNVSIVQANSSDHGKRLLNGSYTGYKGLIQRGEADYGAPFVETTSLVGDLNYGYVSTENEYFICSNDYPSTRSEKDVLYSFSTLDSAAYAIGITMAVLLIPIYYLILKRKNLNARFWTKFAFIHASVILALLFGEAILQSGISTDILVLQKHPKIESLEDIVQLEAQTTFPEHSQVAEDFEIGLTDVHKEVWRLATKEGKARVTLYKWEELRTRERTVFADLRHLDTTLAAFYCFAMPDKWTEDKSSVMLHRSPPFKKASVVFLRGWNLDTIIDEKLNSIEFAYIENGLFTYFKSFNGFIDMFGKLPNVVADCVRNVFNVDANEDIPPKAVDLQRLTSVYWAFIGSLIFAFTLLIFENKLKNGGNKNVIKLYSLLWNTWKTLQ